MDQKNKLEKIAAKSTETVVKKLSEWIGKPVKMEVLMADIIPLEKAEDMISVSEDTLMFYVDVTSSVSKGVSHIFVAQKEAKVLIDLLERAEVGTTKDVNEIGLSALKETTNLIAGVYLNELVKLSGIDLVSSQPFYSEKNGSETIKSKLSEINVDGEVIVFRSNLIVAPHEIKLNLFLFFDKMLLDKLLKS